MDIIRGSGGGGKSGGGSGSTPVESPDSLRSIQYARLLDIVSEGEIGGLVNGLQSVYLNSTPIQNADGSYNFSGAIMNSRNGVQAQSYIPGFDSVEAETGVSVKVAYAIPIVRSISDANANAVRITVSVPSLTFQDMTTGNMTGSSVDFAIDVQTNGGGYAQSMTGTISGKTTSRYQCAYRIELPAGGNWDIRIRRLTADSTQSNLNNDLYWDSYTELIDARLSYPNTALVSLSIDAQNFQSIPSRGYDLHGLLIKIPSNYNPITRAYSGVWNGTFTTAWSDNPAWCLYDMLTSKRYGLGNFIDVSQVDKWMLYQIAQYCDQLVDNGFGGLEPRFTCNLYLQAQAEAYKVIADMAAIFCGMTYWGSSTVIATQDAPGQPVALFTPANVVLDQNGQSFTYSGSALNTRHTVALVAWNDPSDLYQQKIEYVEDVEGIKRYGVIQTSVTALGCTSRGQAHRYGRRILYAERMEGEIVGFTAGLDGLSVAPGEIIQTSDPVRAGVRMGGRLLSATASVLTLDSSVTISSGATYTVWAVMPDGTVESRAVTTGVGTTNTLSVSPAFAAAPQALAMWVLAASNLVPELWRVISITESNYTTAQITAMAYRADKYPAIENGIKLDPLQTSSINQVPTVPADFSASESLYLVTPVVVGTRITVAWMGSATYYELRYRRTAGNWSVLTTSSSSIDIQPVDAGGYEFSLVAVNSIGRRSLPVTMSKEIIGKVAPPADLSGFTVTKSSGVAIASWLQHPDLDVRVGGRIIIRFSPALSSVGWNDGYILEEFDGSTISGILPLITGTYFAKVIDSSGNWSVNAVPFVATEGMVTGFTTVGTSTQASSFNGAHTNVAVVSGALQLDGAVLIDSITGLMDSWGVINALGGTAANGSYLFDAVMDIGSVATRRFEADITALSFDTGDMIDVRLALIDGWDAFDGTVINDCDVTLYVATTNDDPAVTPTWSNWTPFFVSDFTCRAAKFKLDFLSGQSTHNIAISQLTVHAKIPA